MTLRPLPDLLGSSGGFKREYGGNLKARVGYCYETSAAVGAGTTVDVVDGVNVVVVVESFVAAPAATPETNETATTATARKTRLSIFTLFFKEPFLVR